MITKILKRFGFIRKFCSEGHLMEPSWKNCPVCLAPVCGWLVIKGGKLKNKVYTLHEGNIRIGTGLECEIRILQDAVSREHAMISKNNKLYSIIDLNSVTGTYVNNIQISHKDIIDGDILKFGEIEVIFKSL